jgi:general secretion pathway protein D
MPLLGRLFGVHSDTRNKSEVVLLITPRVVRNLGLPDATLLTLAAGNDATPGAETLRLQDKARVALPMARGAAPGRAAASAEANAPATDVPTAAITVSTSGDVAPGSTAAVTLQNRSAATMHGSIGFDAGILQATDGSNTSAIDFELGPGDQKVVVLRALPARERRVTEVLVVVQSAIGPDGSRLSATVDGNPTINVVPK